MIAIIKEQAACLVAALQNHMTKIISMLLAFLAPIQGIMFTVALCIMADTVTGLWKCRKLGEKITSRGLSKVISKMFLYQGTIILVFLVDKYIFGDILFRIFSVDLLLTKFVALILASVELFSADENYRSVKKYGIWHAFKRLVARGKDVKEELKDFDLDKLKNN